MVFWSRMEHIDRREDFQCQEQVFEYYRVLHLHPTHPIWDGELLPLENESFYFANSRREFRANKRRIRLSLSIIVS